MKIKTSIRIISYITVLVVAATLISPGANREGSVSYGASEVYRILELQPTNNYQKDFNTFKDWKSFINVALDRTGGKVEVTRMPVSEFNGKEDDLVSSFDMIYIGTKADQNDTSFADYSHMGDEISIKGFISNKKEMTQRSGRDITASKMTELLEYADAGYPILLTNAVFLDNGNDKLRLDEQSNMYNLLANKLKVRKNGESSDKKYNNVISCNFNEPIVMENLIKINNLLTSKEGKCSLNILEQPEHNGYINATDINNRELKFKFNVGDHAGTENVRYKADLFIDLNSDGKFEDAENMERYVQVQDSKGKSVKADELKRGAEYILTRDVGDYVGIIYWKLQITKYVDEAYTSQKDQVVDYCKVQPKILVDGKEETVKKTLKVLQIMAEEKSGKGITSENNVWMPTEQEASYLESKYKTALAGLHNPTDSQLGTLANTIAAAEVGLKNEYFNLSSNPNQKITEDFLKVTLRFWLYTRDLNEFTINIQRMPVSSFEKNIKSNSINVDDYDMLILGFADCYTDITEEKALKAISGFIKDGKTILFTHDTTSFIMESPSTGKAGEWGYNINKYFRNMLGMDRYGYLSDVYDFGSKQETSKDYTWNEKGKIDYTKRAHGYTDYLMANTTDKNITPKQTTTIVPVNSGQITTYPYELPVNIEMKVGPTHGQYYQLDLEADDIIVWYCLSGGEGNYYGVPNAQGVMEKDVRNHYYIYNRRNITYSGAGHKGLLTDDEIKLFINTMVSAYRAASTAMSIDILNADASRDKGDNVYFNVSYLKDKPKQPIAADIVSVDGKPAKRVFFSLRQNSVANEGKMTITFGNISKICDEKGNVVNEVIENKVYYADIPISQLETNEKMALEAVLTIKYEDEEEGADTKTVKKNISFMRRTMFNLN